MRDFQPIYPRDDTSEKKKPTLWFFFPDYTGSVPYQSLLSQALEEHACAIPGTITDALAAPPGQSLVFHLHWEDALYADAQNEPSAAEMTTDVLARLTSFQKLGGRLIWTMHNAAPHEDRFPALSVALRQSLARTADVVHVHCNTGIELARRLGAPADKILMLPHPDLAVAYPDDITDMAARRYFSLKSEDTVFAYIGANRGYKDVGGLYESFVALKALHYDTCLIMAGRQAGSFEQRYLEPEPGVRLIPRYIDDAVVQYVLRAADFVVLPYRRILSSGALSLALGFGRPVIVPDLPALLDVIHPGADSLCYRAGDVEDLLRAMIEATKLQDSERRRMRDNALQSGQKVTFAMLADALLSALQRLDSR